MNCGSEIIYKLTDERIQLIRIQSGNLCGTHYICLLFSCSSCFHHSCRALPSGSLSRELFARYVRMPIHESAIRVPFPRPDMQRVEGWETESIRGFPIMEKLTHELRWALVLLVPRVCDQ